MSHAQFSQGVCSVAAIIENEPVLGVNDVEKVRSEADPQTDQGRRKPGRGQSLYVGRLKELSLQESEVVGWADKGEDVRRILHHTDGRVSWVNRERRAQNALGRGVAADQILQLVDVGKIDELLEHDEPVEFNHANASRD